MVENQVEEIYAMVSKMEISIVIELNILAATKSLDWWLDFGATMQ